MFEEFCYTICCTYVFIQLKIVFRLDETETHDSPQNRQLQTATTAWILNLGLTRGQGVRLETMVVLKQQINAKHIGSFGQKEKSGFLVMHVRVRKTIK